MKTTTKKLCQLASELYESKNLSAEMIYDLILNSKSRKKEVTKAKQLVSFFLYNHFDMTYCAISREFGFKNHTSVLYHVNEVYFSLRTDKRMKYRHDYILDILNGVERTILRNKPILKSVLSEDDKQFIKDNLNQGYSISYLSDVLNKHKGIIKSFLLNVKKERKSFYIAQN